MKLTKDQVKKVAKLANLPLTVDEEELYTEQLSQILDYIDLLNQADTKDIEPTFNVTGELGLVKDIPNPSLSSEGALKNAPKTKDGFFVTRGVFEE